MRRILPARGRTCFCTVRRWSSKHRPLSTQPLEDHLDVISSTSPLSNTRNEAVVIRSHPQFRNAKIVECVDSKVQYVDPCPSEAELAKIYDEDYNAAFGRDFGAGVPEFVSRRADAQLAFVEQNLDKVEVPGAVVEVGAGWGALSKAVQEKWGIKVQCYELDSDAVAFARKRGVDAKIGTLENDDEVPPASLDLILSSMMLEHVPRPFEAVVAWRRKLKVGGALFVEIPLENPCPNWWGADPERPYWVGHLTFFGRGHLEALLDNAGFDVVNATCHDHPVSPGYVMPGDSIPYDVSKVPLHYDTKPSDSQFPKLLRLLATKR
mmetsp:Transcript_32819/g.104669  ORF Transcript_32819/g.104669 Transcript_32819/m.104669 type:complete len:322 (+) Transcript_32819:61-1026(+)